MWRLLPERSKNKAIKATLVYVRKFVMYDGDISLWLRNQKNILYG